MKQQIFNFARVGKYGGRPIDRAQLNEIRRRAAKRAARLESVNKKVRK